MNAKPKRSLCVTINSDHAMTIGNQSKLAEQPNSKPQQETKDAQEPRKTTEG